MSTYVILQFFFPSIFLQLNEEKEKIQVFFVFSLLSNKLKHFIFHSFIFFYFVLFILCHLIIVIGIFHDCTLLIWCFDRSKAYKPSAWDCRTHQWKIWYTYSCSNTPSGWCFKHLQHICLVWYLTMQGSWVWMLISIIREK